MAFFFLSCSILVLAFFLFLHTLVLQRQQNTGNARAPTDEGGRTEEQRAKRAPTEEVEGKAQKGPDKSDKQKSDEPERRGRRVSFSEEPDAPLGLFKVSVTPEAAVAFAALDSPPATESPVPDYVFRPGSERVNDSALQSPSGPSLDGCKGTEQEEKPKLSPFEAAMAKWPQPASNMVDKDLWNSRNELDDQQPTSANESPAGSKHSEAEIKAVRNIPDVLRARSMEAALGSFQMGCLLGKGSFGKVYKAKWRSTMCAVKVISHDDTSSSAKLDALRESAVSCALQHPNILITYKVLTQPVRAAPLGAQGSSDSAQGLYGPTSSLQANLLAGAAPSKAALQKNLLNSSERGSPNGGQLPPHLPFEGTDGTPLVSRTYANRCRDIEDSLETWMLMEYCDKGNLDKAIQAGRFRLREEPDKQDLVAIYRTLIDIAAGMDFLHSVGVLHGDLKSCNVLLKSTSIYDDPRGFIAKLADFGLSQILDTEAGLAHVSTNSYGTVAYMPSELLQDGKMTKEVDVWSFGCIMWELWCRERMYQNVNLQQVFCRVLTGRRTLIPDTMPAGFKELLEACWAADPSQRPPFEDITRWLRTLYYGLNGGERDCRKSLDMNPWD